MFEPHTPPGLSAAKQKAIQLVGAQELRKAEADGDKWIESKLASTTELFGIYKADTLPKLLFKGADGSLKVIDGQYSSGDKLTQILSREMDFQVTGP
jgi:hypothetical protein